MQINNHYMLIVITKLLDDIRAKEYVYASNGVKVKIALGEDEAHVLLEALQAADKESRE